MINRRRSKLPKKAKLSTKEKPDDFVEPDFKVIGIKSRNKLHYDESFHPQDFVQHCREGNTLSYILGSWGIYDSTFRLWISKYPVFSEAAKIGKMAFQAFWHDRAREHILNKKSYMNFAGFVWFSKNTMGWSDTGRDEFADTGPTMEYNLYDEATGETFNAKMEKIDKK